MALFPSTSISSGGSAYDIDNSCRFNDDNNAYLSFTPSSSGNRKTWTASFWMKRGNLQANVPNYDYVMFGCQTNDSRICFSNDDGGDCLRFVQNASPNFEVITKRKFRDTSAWYHIVIALDTTQATATNRIKIYVNGDPQETDFVSGKETYPSQNDDLNWNHTLEHGIGRTSQYSNRLYDGQLAEIHWVDGTALDPTSFGKAGDYGEWKAKEYSGSHGTNGFYLDFSGAGTKHAVTPTDVVHSTTQYKVGGSSMNFPANADYLAIGDSDDWDFGTGDFTWEMWIYLGAISSQKKLFGSNQWGTQSADYIFDINPTRTVRVQFHGGSGSPEYSTSSTVPVSTWCHVAAVRESGHVRIYIDGVQGLSVATALNQNLANSGTPFLGWKPANTGDGFVGYMDEIRLSNTCRYPSGTTFTAFGQGGGTISSPTPFESDANTLLLIHSDTTNGSTTFTDSSGVTGALGNDSAGSNHFTPSGITASDQMLDSPTNNFCVMNNLDNYWQSATFSKGNLQIATTAGGVECGNTATMGMSSGKWYWEVYVVDSPVVGGVSDMSIGIMGRFATAANHNPGHSPYSWGFYSYPTQNIVNNNSYVTYGTNQAYLTGDIVSVAVDLVNNKLYFAVNNTYLNSGNPAGNSNGLAISAAALTDIGAYMPAFGDFDQGQVETGFMNFGQDGTFGGNKTAQGNADDNGYGNFKYAPPTGFLSLCSKNLPEPAVVPSEHFNTVLYTGNGATNTVPNVGFQPDFAWLKNRTHVSYYHELYDSVRGVTKILHSNATTAEYTEAVNSLTAFNSDGFVLTGNSYGNRNTSPYVAWNWKANGSGASNTDGTINTTATSANVSAGFSISTYTGTGSNATVGHGLAVAPTLVIVKRRSATNAWQVGTLLPLASLDFTDQLVLNTTGAADTTAGNWWNNTAPTASVFSIGSNDEVNASTNTFVAYCWHSVEGYSKIGSYKGNANADGTFIYTGFQPAYVMMKNLNAAGQSWCIFDNKRDTYNLSTHRFHAEDATAEGSDNHIDILSNGFKCRTSNQSTNGTEYFLYMAFAENPFKYTNAR